ncbi:N-acyl homoserine lactonase family protein [Novosphingobium sp. JCM 18896]|uniref:N-acyl homoserine lactonase family protein n=1 Tax=Novosphingobium sp. JCM 18896 TaxID=2989731 RepID=UPI0022222B0B|nr:N-acyl homoserine lactonase family protein [Novosphingobium sp. JCM 18896]MCW1432270.1 N-acyl homoserine lactonase family protein [Novosphingobium sp. JCM 18896]
MKLRLLGLTMIALVSSAAAPRAEPGHADRLWRLDCGTIFVPVLDRLSDSYRYPGQSRELVVSCYLIKKGGSYLLWDTGFSRDLVASADANQPRPTQARKTIVEQLRRLGIKPEQVAFVGISHYHYDHVGQAGNFPSATLLIGQQDLAVARASEAVGRPLAHWFQSGASVRAVQADEDVYGDGSVTMLNLPGHTSGHHGLLIRLASGPVLLSGDVAHFHGNLDANEVPSVNVDRAASLASMDRYRRIAQALRANVIIQHDPDDVGKLPVFPEGKE